MKSPIRKILLAFAFAGISMAFATGASAQLVSTYKPVKDTLVNADTTMVALFPNNDVVSFHFKAEKVSGTVAGTATLQGSLDGLFWFTVGTAYTLTNIAHNQVMIEPTRLNWAKYRFLVITVAGCKINGIRAYDVRRS